MGRSMVRAARLVGLALCLLACAMTAGAVPNPDAIAHPRLQLPAPARGAEAVNLLGNRLGEVAARYGMTPTALAATLRRDKDLWIDRQSRLVYLCTATPGRDQAAEPTPAKPTVTRPQAPFPLAETFRLHSLTGSTRVIYLDFDGHTTSGTAWNSQFTGNRAIASSPYDLDGDPSAFGVSELEAIQKIWQVVSEDYAPFDVDVTTQEPDREALRRTGAGDVYYGVRVVISPSDSWYKPVGGVAFVGSFTWDSDTPCFAFSGSFGSNAKNVGEVVSHEVGHTGGLSHDGAANGTEYYAGHGEWAPIMGSGYGRSVVQFSRGEYGGANNREDDLAVLGGYGIAYRGDDHPDTLAGARPLTGSRPVVSGTIERNTDVDAFTFTTGAGPVQINVDVAPNSPNLDVQLDLYNAEGGLVASRNPAGLNASLTQDLTPGRYFVVLDGVGAGSPVNEGYSGYASIGQYTLSVAPTGSTNASPTAVASATPTSGAAPLTVAFGGDQSSDSDGSIAAYAWEFGDGGTATVANPSHTYLATGTYTARLTVTDDLGAQGSATVTINVTDLQAPDTLSAVALSSSRIQLTWKDNSRTETGFEIERKSGTADFSRVFTTNPDLTRYEDGGLAPNTVYTYRVRAVSGAARSGYSNEAGATTATDLPAAPTNLRYTLTSATELSLNWNDNATNEDGYVVEWKFADGQYARFNPNWAAGTTGIGVGSLVPGVTYLFRVYAFNGAGNSPYSNELTVAVPQVAPAAPTNLRFTLTSATELDLNWNDNAGNEDGYVGEWTVEGREYTRFQNNWPVDATSRHIINLAPGVTYLFRVYAFNAGGASGFSNEIRVAVPHVVPATPTNLRHALTSSTELDLNWDDNANNEDGYVVEWRFAQGEFTRFDPNWAADTRGIRVGSLVPGATYYFRVYAFNRAGTSAYSNEAAVTIPQEPLRAPAQLVARALGGGRVRLTWTDANSSETSFRVDMGASTRSLRPAFTQAPNVTSITVSRLRRGQTYYFRVRAERNGDYSSYSNIALSRVR